jgi:hypothetical protein
MQLTMMRVWAVGIALLIAVTGSLVRAAVDLDCASKDGELQIDHMDYRGDSLPTDNFEITFQETNLPEGTATRHRFSDGVFALDISTGDGLVFSVDAKADPNQEPTAAAGTYSIEQGFVISQGILFPLDGGSLFCRVG